MWESVYAKNLDHELLADYEEVMLLSQAQDGDEDAREKLILSNLRFVRSIVQQYANPELMVYADDLMGDGIIGLCKAISGFSFDLETS